MVDYSDIADQLQHEVVTEMAEGFFGERKNLEEMIEAFEAMVEELREFLPLLHQSAERVFRLLLDDDGIRDFSAALGISFAGLSYDNNGLNLSPEKLPFAFTERGRYEKCLAHAYDQLRARIDEYVNGRYFDDPDEKGRKRLTVHYLRLKALSELINEKVEKVNRDLSPSGTLRYVKRMDTVQAELEEMIGQACLMEGCELDTDLKFTPIDFEGIGLPVLEELPHLAAINDDIRRFCKKLYPSRKQEIMRAMARLRDG